MWDTESPHRRPSQLHPEADAATDVPEAPAEKPVYLLAGDWYVSAQNTRVTTILGSCVAVCLFDPYRHIGGLNHFLLAQGGAPSVGKPGRFADLALPQLLDGMLQLGARRQDLLGKIFGGSGQFRSGHQGTIGEENVEAARRFLLAHHIPVVSEDVGGDRGRRLVFFTGDGTALVKPL